MGDTNEVLLTLGSATLGESGGRPMHPRIHAVLVRRRDSRRPPTR